MSYLQPDRDTVKAKQLSDDTLLVYDSDASPPETGRWIYGDPVPNER